MAPSERDQILPNVVNYHIDTEILHATQTDPIDSPSARSDDSTIVCSPAKEDKDESFPLQHKTATVQVHELETVVSHNEVQATSWKCSLLRPGPLGGLSALGLAVLHVFATYLILLFSDGEPTDTWRYQPSVYLAILTSISNKAIAFAALQGTVATFWRHALQGTTMGQLHRDWSYGLYAYVGLVDAPLDSSYC